MQPTEIADNCDSMVKPMESMMKPREQFRPDDVHAYLKEIFAGDVHAKRVLSLAKATTGVPTSGSLAVAAIGQGMAHTCGTRTKHAVKQVDRLVGNDRVDVWDYFRLWVPHVVAEREHVMVALDWTDFARDGHQTVSLNLLTSHGRAIPLVWRTVESRGLKGHRNEYEDSVLRRLRETLPEGVCVTVIADRGFFDVELLEVLRDCWGFGYVVRMRGNIQVASASGETRSAAEWVGAGGRARTLRGAKLTQAGFEVPTVVCTKAKGMKEPWCLAVSDAEAKAAEVVKHYARRWSIECYFRDTKDLRFGMGMDAIHTKSPARRDRLFLLSALAIVLLTLLGAACEKVGYDRYLKANTVKTRTHSLFRQGLMVYELMPNMREGDLTPILEAFAEALHAHRATSTLFAAV